jgi:hypothetical protein
MTAPVDEVVERACARTAIRSKTSLRNLGAVVENYRRWCRDRETPATAPGEEHGAEALP